MKSKLPFLIPLLLLLLSKIGYCQNFTLPNEEVLHSFQTADNKKMVLAKDTADKYLVYRFGTNEKIEFEFPEKDSASWKIFTYSFYLRGGGAQNEGLDLNYLYFTKDSLQYVIPFRIIN